MSISCFTSIKDLTAVLLERMDSYEVISFDMFDTLLIRRTHDPDIVKNATIKYIAALAKEKGVWSSFNQVEGIRNEIECAHRQKNGATYPDYEANYAEFMPEVLQRIFGKKYHNKIYQLVTDYELSMESALLVARQDFVSLIKQLKANDKKLYLLSDIYLPGEFLQQLLADKDLDHYFEAIISSADSFQAKASGAGFIRLAEQYQLDKNTWLHIGDNAWSDGKQASEFGLTAYLINDPQEAKRKNLARRYDFLGSKQMIWAGRNIQQLMLPLEAENKDYSELYVDGYQFFAYLFGTMLVKLKQQADQQGIKKLYFCAREGWLLKKCWEIMAPVLWPAEHHNYKLHYLYVSRLSLAQASRANAGLGFADIENALRPINNRDFTDVARVYGLNAEELVPFLAKYELRLDTDISAIGRSDDTIKKLYHLCDDEEFNQVVKKQAQDANKALCNYLSEQEFFTDKQQLETVALIDIGWVGTIQSYLNTAISHRSDRPVIQGFLMASVAAKASLYPQTQYSKVTGLLYDEGHFSSLASILNVCRDVFEELTRASHPTLLEYQLKTSKPGYTLRFRSEEHDSYKLEQQQFEYYTDLHQGIFDGVKRFAEAVAICKYQTQYLQQWCEVLILGRLGMPENAEVARLQNRYHQDDFARQGEQRKLNKNLQKQVDAEQTVWNVSRGMFAKFRLGKRYYLNRFLRSVKRR